jgi:cation:H+ antiporter
MSGLTVLVAGAEMLVRGASKLATRLGISPVVIGLTIVAFGTSSPEMAVSLGAAWSGQTDLVVGNAVGSNIFNILLILGISALITPLVVHQRFLWVDVPIMIGSCGLLWLLVADKTLSRADGLFLFSGLVGYTFLALRLAGRETRAVEEEYAEAVVGKAAAAKGYVRPVMLIGLGLVLCVVGSRWMVTGAVSVAQAAGLSELVIGLTIVAAGTSLPEVATSIMSAVRGQRDIAVGNVIGSNIFNVFGILGISSLTAPGPIVVSPAALSFDVPVMTAVALACLPVLFTGHVISRWEGGILFSYYVIYLGYLIMAAAEHDGAKALGGATMWFVIPLTIAALAFSVLGGIRSRVYETKTNQEPT